VTGEQLTLDQARQRGERAADACVAKAQTVGFDAEGARQFILAALRSSPGPLNGEKLVNAAKAAGFVGHDDRCFGSVFSVLARRELIRCVGFENRAKGRGAPGARLWEAT
jgi:hypothetical protein